MVVSLYMFTGGWANRSDGRVPVVAVAASAGIVKVVACAVCAMECLCECASVCVEECVSKIVREEEREREIERDC